MKTLVVILLVVVAIAAWIRFARYKIRPTPDEFYEPEESDLVLTRPLPKKELPDYALESSKAIEVEEDDVTYQLGAMFYKGQGKQIINIDDSGLDRHPGDMFYKGEGQQEEFCLSTVLDLLYQPLEEKYRDPVKICKPKILCQGNISEAIPLNYHWKRRLRD